jgi:hypothetical protein
MEHKAYMKIFTFIQYNFVFFLICALSIVTGAVQSPNKAIGVVPVKAVDHVGVNRYALVIGINDYGDDHIPDLQTC